ncbi:MAG: Phosphoenolpyruvate-dihydroxyacetone phosphotransferase, subunit DhaM; DHA-specific IIA component, partial [uncultured Rubrobacteraceae bacterium]
GRPRASLAQPQDRRGDRRPRQADGRGGRDLGRRRRLRGGLRHGPREDRGRHKGYERRRGPRLYGPRKRSSLGGDGARDALRRGPGPGEARGRAVCGGRLLGRGLRVRGLGRGRVRGGGRGGPHGAQDAL